MGKPRVIAETGAGQHGVATATACARFGLDCVVYMGEEDIRRQRPNVFSMKLLGAEVRPVRSGSRTLRDAINEAFRDWMSSVETTHYCLGSVVGPHPFPRIVRDFQSVIGRETRAQCLEQLGRLPDVVVACVGGGSNAAGMFYPFVADDGVALVGVEAGGRSDQARRPCRHALLRPARRAARQLQLRAPGRRRPDLRRPQRLGRPGLSRHRARSTATGKRPAGSRTPAPATTRPSAAFDTLARTEGILPALESSHAVAEAMKLAARRKPDEVDRGLPLRPRRQGRRRSRPAAGRRGVAVASCQQFIIHPSFISPCPPSTHFSASFAPPAARRSCLSSRRAIPTWISRAA